MLKLELQAGDENIVIEHGKVAKQAHGAVWVQRGGTVVLVTAVSDSRAKEELDFVPLTVDFRERMYAAGKVPQIYGRREPRPGNDETLTARQIDHSIRPLFPKSYRCETQVQAMVLSADGVHPAEDLAILGASASFSISDIPFAGPIGGLTVARVNGEMVAWPTYQQLEASDLHFFVTGTKTAVMSLEGAAHEAPEEDVIQAIAFAHEQIVRMVDLQDELITAVGKPKREVIEKEAPEGLEARMRELTLARIGEATGIVDSSERDAHMKDVRNSAIAELGEEFADEEDAAKTIFRALEKEVMRRSILDEGKRLDGRGVDELRGIESEVGILPRAHGSALFTRGQTQALAAATLGTAMDANAVRGLLGEDKHTFFLHYNFPGYSVGEVRRIMGASRREIGHGALAEAALAPVIPSQDDFPYTIRLVSEILESSASSSMATVCAGSLALMDGGVPIKKQVAGVGVGLIKEGDQEVILTDMIGTEDFLGDMDFKVAGTSDGITAIQLDIKIDGLSIDLMRRALEQARGARMRVLDLMNASLGQPREELSEFAPRIHMLRIDPGRIGELIGPGGKIIRGIQEEFGVTITVEEDGSVQVATADAAGAAGAIAEIESIFAVAEVGQEYTGKVTRIAPFGAFIEVLKGRDGLVHISDLANGFVRRVEDCVNIGDEVAVRVVNVDDRGRIDLEPVTKFEGSPEGEGGGDDDGGGGGERRGGGGGDRRGGGGGGGYRGGGGGGGDRRGGGGDRRGGGGDRRGGGGGGDRRGGGGGERRGGGSGERRTTSSFRGNRDGGSREGGRSDAPRVPKGRF